MDFLDMLIDFGAIFPGGPNCHFFGLYYALLGVRGSVAGRGVRQGSIPFEPLGLHFSIAFSGIDQCKHFTADYTK